MRQEFRTDIEGLRAIAIIPILLFHLDSALCPGGFVGVDIFFVISGYLITRMILNEGDAFDFKTFYLRRFFRLFPALIVTLLASLVAGWWVLTPNEYEQLARSALAAAVGISNFHFLTAVDYFNASSLEHPLLHTWSLGLEEQFYLVWPSLLIATRRWKMHFWLIIIGLAALSFVALEMIQPNYPQLVFYMMPFRFFEFAIGASVLGLQRYWSHVPNWASASAVLIATALLALAFTGFNSQTPWPSVFSFVPSLGTALLILAGDNNTSSRVLGHWLPRFLGRISYSIYLVHWPLITLYRAYTITDPMPVEIAMLGLVSIGLGALLYATVESRFRFPRSSQDAVSTADLAALPRKILLPNHSVVTALAAMSVAFFVFSTAIVAANGFPSRLDRARLQFLDHGLTFAGDLCNQHHAKCLFGDHNAKFTVYLLGDSYALNLVHGLDGLFRANGIRGVAFYDHGCLFAYDTKRFLNGVPDEKCRRHVADAYEYVANTKDPVIVAGNYAGYRNEIGPSDATAPLRQDEAEYYQWLRKKFTATLAKLRADARPVILIKQPYMTGIDLAKCLAKPIVASNKKLSDQLCAPLPLERVRELYFRADAMIDEAVTGLPLVVTIDPKLLFCNADGCATRDSVGLYFRDTAHLTNSGSDFLVERARGILLHAVLGAK